MQHFVTQEATVGHTGTGPMNSSNAPYRHPDLGPPQEFPPKFVGYQPEMWAVQKDIIFAAIHSIEIAIGYMPHIKSDVPQWQNQTDADIQQMQITLEKLRKLPG